MGSWVDNLLHWAFVVGTLVMFVRFVGSRSLFSGVRETMVRFVTFRAMRRAGAKVSWKQLKAPESVEHFMAWEGKPPRRMGFVRMRSKVYVARPTGRPFVTVVKETSFRGPLLWGTNMLMATLEPDDLVHLTAKRTGTTAARARAKPTTFAMATGCSLLLPAAASAVSDASPHAAPSVLANWMYALSAVAVPLLLFLAAVSFAEHAFARRWTMGRGATERRVSPARMRGLFLQRFSLLRLPAGSPAAALLVQRFLLLGLLGRVVYFPMSHDALQRLTALGEEAHSGTAPGDPAGP